MKGSCPHYEKKGKSHRRGSRQDAGCKSEVSWQFGLGMHNFRKLERGIPVKRASEMPGYNPFRALFAKLALPFELSDRDESEVRGIVRRYPNVRLKTPKAYASMLKEPQAVPRPPPPQVDKKAIRCTKSKDSLVKKSSKKSRTGRVRRAPYWSIFDLVEPEKVSNVKKNTNTVYGDTLPELVHQLLSFLESTVEHSKTRTKKGYAKRQEEYRRSLRVSKAREKLPIFLDVLPFASPRRSGHRLRVGMRSCPYGRGEQNPVKVSRSLARAVKGMKDKNGRSLRRLLWSENFLRKYIPRIITHCRDGEKAVKMAASLVRRRLCRYRDFFGESNWSFAIRDVEIPSDELRALYWQAMLRREDARTVSRSRKVAYVVFRHPRTHKVFAVD